MDVEEKLGGKLVGVDEMEEVGGEFFYLATTKILLKLIKILKCQGFDVCQKYEAGKCFYYQVYKTMCYVLK